MKTCPLGHTCDSCIWNVQVQGYNPQTGLPVDKWDCAIALIPIMLVQVGGKTDQVAAAVETTRNTISQGASLLAQATRPKLKVISDD